MSTTLPTPAPETGHALDTESTHELMDLWHAGPAPVGAYLGHARTHPRLVRWWQAAPPTARAQALILAARSLVAEEARRGGAGTARVLDHLGPGDGAGHVARALLGRTRSGAGGVRVGATLGAAEAAQVYAVLWASHPAHVDPHG